MLAEFTFERLEGGTLYLRSPEIASNAAEFVKRDPRSLEELASQAFGRKIRLSFVEQRVAAPAAPAAGALEVSEIPFVQDAMELFDAHVVQVNRLSGGSADGDSTKGTSEEPDSDSKAPEKKDAP